MVNPKCPPPTGLRPPPRPNTPEDYIPTPVRIIAPTDTLPHLLNKEQGSPVSVKVHPLPQERFGSIGSAPASTPTSTASFRNSWKSRRSVVGAVVRRVSSTLDLSKEAIKNKVKKIKTPTSGNKDQPSRPSSSSSTESLFKMHRLPKLQIPDLRVAVEKELNSACSTDTQLSPNFQIVELSPTSRELRYQWQREHGSADICAEFHNMLSARRRIRKGAFGTLVTSYCQARPTWQDAWGLRVPNDNLEDRVLLKKLTDALQKQKDYATKLAQKNPNYPGFESVSDPGCTFPLYWQHKSSYC